jgi:hypothetical protein
MTAMTVRTLPRTMVSSSVRLARLPVDTALRLAPGLSDSARDRIELHVDRWEAGVRQVAGVLLADRELRSAGNRQEAAADYRQDADELRAQADELARDGAERARATRRSSRQRAGDVEGRRKEASRTVAARAEARIDRAAKRARLESLDHQARALAEREEAVTAEDEAQRLRREAGKAKAARRRRSAN